MISYFEWSPSFPIGPRKIGLLDACERLPGLFREPDTSSGLQYFVMNPIIMWIIMWDSVPLINIELIYMEISSRGALLVLH